MKIKKIQVALLLLCAMFTACNDYDPGLVESASGLTDQEVAVLKEYTRNFVARYGNIDPNHTWGFGEEGSMTTRAEMDMTEQQQQYKPQIPIGHYDGTEFNGEEFDEVEYVKGIFKNKGTSEVVFNYGNYFVQHVYFNTEKIEDTYYFAARDYKRGGYSKTNEQDKSSGLNSKNESKYRDDKDFAYAFYTSMGYGNTNEGQFGFVDKDGVIHTDYIIISVELPNGEHAYYLGFNLSGEENPNYSDWIVKLTPTGNSNTNTEKYVRIMCEDLGSTSDFDFNDIVFDVDINSYVEVNGKWSVDITVQAAGGTLPVYIGNYYDPRNEVHAILGGPTNTPINVGIGNSAPAAKKTITVETSNPKDIKLYGRGTKLSTKNVVAEICTNYKAEGITAPQKICVPVNTKWTRESKDIGEAYGNFSKWVQNNAEFKGVNSWTETNKKDELLY